MAEALEEHILRALPDRYKSTHNQVREWEVLLGQELGNYLDRIEESIRGFVSARPKILSILTLFERDESAESILREYVEGRLNGVPLQLLFDDFTRFRGEQHFLNNDAGAEHGDGMDRMDRRSVTMAAEPATNTDTQQAAINMAPPPRPSAPEAPMTPYTPSNPRQNSDAPPMAGPSGQHSVSNSSVRTHVQDTSVPGPHSTGKRLIDNSELEDQHQSLQSPSKRPKTNWSRLLPVIEVSRFVCMYEVVDDDYIFKDARCGSGWLVIRCNIKEIQFVNVPTRFTQHPLENNLALEHFNQKSKCHLGPPKNKYTEEVILQKFAFRGKYYLAPDLKGFAFLVILPCNLTVLSSIQ